MFIKVSRLLVYSSNMYLFIHGKTTTNILANNTLLSAFIPVRFAPFRGQLNNSSTLITNDQNIRAIGAHEAFSQVTNRWRVDVEILNSIIGLIRLEFSHIIRVLFVYILVQKCYRLQPVEIVYQWQGKSSKTHRCALYRRIRGFGWSKLDWRLAAE